MKFNSDVYDKLYHTPEAEPLSEAGGGVVEPQPKPDAKPETETEQTDEPKQTTTDVNINVNLTTGEAGKAGEAETVSETDATGESENE